MQWMDQRESIRIGDKTYKYGQEVPLELIPTKTVEKFKAKGQLGAIPEKYDPAKHFSERVKELEAEKSKLKTEIKDLKAEIKDLKCKPTTEGPKKEKSK